MSEDKARIEATLTIGAAVALAAIVLILSVALVCIGNALDAARTAQAAQSDRTAELEQENTALRQRIADLEESAAAAVVPGPDATQDAESLELSEPVMEYLGRYYITGYDTCAACCGKTDGITASGAVAQVGRTAASNTLPFGTRIYIDGIGTRTIEDCGSMKDYVIDVLCVDHPACYAITGWYEVYEIKEGE